MVVQLGTGRIKMFDREKGFGFIIPDKEMKDRRDTYFKRNSGNRFHEEMPGQIDLFTQATAWSITRLTKAEVRTPINGARNLTSLKHKKSSLIARILYGRAAEL